MKVLIIHTGYKQKGGEDSVVLNEIQLLKNAGAEVLYLEFNNDKNTLLSVLQLPFNIASYKITKRKIREFKPDVVHIHNLHFAGSPAVIYAAKSLSVPVVLTLHNYRLLCPSATLFYNGQLFTNSLNQKFPFSAAIKGVYRKSRLLTSWLSISMWLHQLAGTWQLVNKYIALTSHTQLLFQDSKLATIAQKIVIKPNFCFPVNNISNKAGKYYLYVGRLSEEKGINVLLEAFKANNLPLRIAGTGPMENEVLAAAKAYNNIVFLGGLPKQEVAKLFDDAIVLVFTSQWYEPFGMVIIEAFAAGVPVISSAIGHLHVTIKNKLNGLLFNTGDAIDLNSKLLYYNELPDTEKLAYRLCALKTYKEQYTPEINIETLLDLYSGVIAG